MIITQTPLRLSFFGGGTDFPDFYKKFGGSVLSTTIDKYIYVIVKKRFDSMIRVGYTETELVYEPKQVKHDLVRVALAKTGIRNSIEIATMADIPSEGSGLGSSSAVTVGLLNALWGYSGVLRDKTSLAQEACEVEIDILKAPIGVQDQYAAAFGGLRIYNFGPAYTVTSNRLKLDEGLLQALDSRLLLFYTGVERKANSILSEQKANIAKTESVLKEMKSLVSAATVNLTKGDLPEFGKMLHYTWELKKSLASKVSNGPIDAMYLDAIDAGALGGKVAGAGGGGFLMLYVPQHKQDSVRYALRGLRELPFTFDKLGTRTVLNIQ